MNTNRRRMWLFLGPVLALGLLMLGCETKGKRPVASLDSAKDLVIKQIYKDALGERAMFASAEPKQSGVMIGTWPTPEKVTVEKDSWFFFIDEAPDANWEHPATFVLVEKETGTIRSIPVSTPPRELPVLKPMNPVAQEQLRVLEMNRRFVRDIDLLDKPVFIEKKSKYAVLVSGGWDAPSNHARYWNDLASIYEALKKKYSYTDEEIIVLYANGTHLPNEDLDGDGTDDIDYAATESNLTSVMENVAKTIGADGKFFFFSTNHGGHETGHDAYLYLWGETILDDEFGALTKDITCAHAIYVMEQCFSGGMMDDVLTAQTYPCNNPKVCVMTAARHDEVSWAADTEGAYDEYVYHWTAAVYGKTPGGTIVNADADGNGVVSMEEAHEYAKSNDSRSEHPLIGSCVADACDASLSVGVDFAEDCVSFDPNTTTVRQIDGQWKVVDGNAWLFDFGASATEANQTLNIVTHYGANQVCYVGRPDASFQYLLVSGNSPTGSMSGEDCISFDPANAAVQQIDGRWKIVDGASWLFDYGSNETEARQSLEIITHYGFNRVCYVGRPDASFQYMRK